MIAIIRIHGRVNIDSTVERALSDLRLRRKYTCTLIKPTEENLKLLQKLRNFVAFGDINTETLKLLIDLRGQPVNKTKKIDADKIVKELDKKDINELTDMKPFFRLHPPRGGIDTKLHFGVSKKAVLGDNKKEINSLLRRML
jgi:large subunit ribosomal protein L30